MTMLPITRSWEHQVGARGIAAGQSTASNVSHADNPSVLDMWLNQGMADEPFHATAAVGNHPWVGDGNSAGNQNAQGHAQDPNGYIDSAAASRGSANGNNEVTRPS